MFDRSTRHRTRILLHAALMGATFSGGAAYGQTVTWDGEAADDNWNSPNNWDTNSVPNGASFDVVIGSPAPTLLNINVTLNSVIVNADGSLTLVSGTNLDLTGNVGSFLSNAGTITSQNNTDLVFVNTVVNSGSINISAGVSATDIELRGALNSIIDLDGGGTITLSGANARITDVDVNHRTLRVLDQLIQGNGQLGVNDISVEITAGNMVDANVDGGTLELDPSGSGPGFTNAGTLQASGGGLLALTGFGGGGFHNAGGLIQALNGSEVRLRNGASVTGGTLATSGTGIIRVEAGQNIVLTDVTLNGTLISENNTDTGASGTITNHGLIEIQSGGSNTDLELRGAANSTTTLAGSGVLQLTGLNAGINDMDANQRTLVNDTGHTIRGQGSIGQNGIVIVNNHLIQANVSGQALTLDPMDAVGDADFDNNGTLEAVGGGVLVFTGLGGGSFDNAGGTIRALAGSEVQLTNSASVAGGTVTTSGGGVIRVLDGQQVYLADLTNGGTLIANNGSDTGVIGTIDNTGTIQINAGGSLTALELAGAANSTTVLTGGGTTTLSGSNARITDVDANNRTLDIQDQTVRGEGNIGANTVDVNVAAGNLVDANVNGGTLTLDPSSSALGFTNAGTLRASAGGVLQLTGSGGGGFNNAGGTIQALAGSEVRLTTNASVAGGTLTTSGGGVIRGIASQNYFLADLTHAGTFIAENNTDTGISGTITNTGSILIDSGGSITSLELNNAPNGSTTLTGAGTVTLAGVNARVDDGDANLRTLINTGGHTIQGRGNVGADTINVDNAAGGTLLANVSGETLAIRVQDAFSNAGTLRATNGGTLTANRGFTNEGTITIDNGGGINFTGTVTNGVSGRIQGDDDSFAAGIGASAGIVSNGVIAPGVPASPGSPAFGFLNLVAAVELGDTSLLEFEIGGDTTGVSFDYLSVWGGLELGGNLSVAVVNGFTPAETDRFQIIHTPATDALTGAFANVASGATMLSQDGLWEFTVTYGDGAVELSNFVLIPEPASVSILLAVSGLALRRRQR